MRLGEDGRQHARVLVAVFVPKVFVVVVVRVNKACVQVVGGVFWGVKYRRWPGFPLARFRAAITEWHGGM